MNALAPLSLALILFGCITWGASCWALRDSGPGAVAADWPSADLQPIPMEKPL